MKLSKLSEYSRLLVVALALALVRKESATISVGIVRFQLFLSLFSFNNRTLTGFILDI